MGETKVGTEVVGTIFAKGLTCVKVLSYCLLNSRNSPLYSSSRIAITPSTFLQVHDALPTRQHRHSHLPSDPRRIPPHQNSVERLGLKSTFPSSLKQNGGEKDGPLLVNDIHHCRRSTLHPSHSGGRRSPFLAFFESLQQWVCQ
jgi:hypothetical protein